MTTQKPLNLKQIALEVFGDTKRESSIRAWAKAYKIPSTLTDKERLFDASLVPIFKQIKALKAERPRLSDDAVLANIARLLEDTVAHVDDAPLQRLVGMRGDISLAPLMEKHSQTVISSVHEIIKAEAQTSEKYAQASHKIGQLEVMLRVTQDQLAEAQKQILLLPETTQALAEARKEAEDLKAELERERVAHANEALALRGEIEERDRLEAERLKKAPWWKIWTK